MRSTVDAPRLYWATSFAFVAADTRGPLSRNASTSATVGMRSLVASIVLAYLSTRSIALAIAVQSNVHAHRRARHGD